jgi:hypothetical protein
MFTKKAPQKFLSDFWGAFLLTNAMCFGLPAFSGTFDGTFGGIPPLKGVRGMCNAVEEHNRI